MKKAILVGAGLSAATAATILKRHNYFVEVFETRPHVAGNCYDSEIKGIKVHNYGPHGFQTNDDWVWRFVNEYDTFNSFRLQVNARLSDGNIINIPYNLNTQDIVGEWSPDKIVDELFISLAGLGVRVLGDFDLAISFAILIILSGKEVRRAVRGVSAALLF